EHQQEIKRSLETFHIDNHGWLCGTAVGAERGVEILAAHEPAFHSGAMRSSAIICAKRLRATLISNFSGTLRAARALSARFAGSPANSGASPATAIISLRLPLQ